MNEEKERREVRRGEKETSDREDKDKDKADKKAKDNETLIEESLPVHDPYPFVTIDKVWNEEQLTRLLQLVRDFGSFPTTSRDQTSPVDHIGEAVATLPDGTCAHHLMVPNKNGTYCTLPHRVDVATQYLKTGGRAGIKESVPRLVSRLLSFPKFLIGDDSLALLKDEVDTLFKNKEYLAGQDRVCEGRKVLDPFQLGLIVQIPGQQVAAHLDAPWFWGGDRMNLPQWLLVVMEHSKLWENVRVHQLQGVAYVHDWNTTDLPPGGVNEKYGGGFYFYPSGSGGPSEVFEARTGAAILCDGSVMVHGTEPFQVPGAPPRPPLINKDATTDLVYQGDDLWDVVSNGKRLETYKTTDLRISFVWRARCFESEEELERYKAFPPSITVEEVLDKLVADLESRGVLAPGQPRPAPLDLAQLLLDTYIKYPSGGLTGFNYCVVPTVLPKWAQPAANYLMSPLCD